MFFLRLFGIISLCGNYPNICAFCMEYPLICLQLGVFLFFFLILFFIAVVNFMVDVLVPAILRFLWIEMNRILKHLYDRYKKRTKSNPVERNKPRFK